jgi:UDP-2,3-diacylglucosamine hydrolase
MKPFYFISDVHLGACSGSEEHVRIQRLISFLKHIRDKADRLYIVGDLYNFWFEYRHAIPKVNLAILATFMQLVKDGVEIHYLTGNHDLWQRNYLQDEVGFVIHHGPVVVEAFNQRLYVVHGDGLAHSDAWLRFTRKIFESRFNNMLFRLLHPDIGIALANYWSRKSAEKGENKFYDEYLKLATSKLKEGFDAFIYGHTHKPNLQVLSEGKFMINVGDWLTNFTYLSFTSDGFDLKAWNVNQNHTPKQELMEKRAV